MYSIQTLTYDFNKIILVEYNTPSEDFYHQFLNESYSHEDCQVQINASFDEVVINSETGAKYILFILIPELNAIHSVNAVLFKLKYFSKRIQRYVEAFHSTRTDFSGLHKPYLENMKILLPIEDADDAKQIEVWSHSHKPCKGAHNGSFLIPAVSLQSPTEVQLRSKSKSDSRTQCSYLNISRIGNRTRLTSPSTNEYERDRYMDVKSASMSNGASITEQNDGSENQEMQNFFLPVVLSLILFVICAFLIDLACRKFMRNNRLELVTWKIFSCCLRRPDDNNEQRNVPTDNGIELREVENMEQSTDLTPWAIREDVYAPSKLNLRFTLRKGIVTGFKLGLKKRTLI